MMRTVNKILAVILLLALICSPLTVSALEPFYTGTPSEPSEAYRGSKYYDNLAAVELTGDMAYDIIKVALSQVGYHAGNSEAQLDGENKEGYADYNEYSYWWDGVANRSWCAAFITYCARQAQIPNTVLKGTLAANATAFDLPMTPKASADPRIGDLIFFDWDLDGSSDHVGLVAKVSEDTVLVVHGNYKSFATVTRFSRSQIDVLGYARPAYTSAYWMGEPISLMLSENCRYIYEDGVYFRNLLDVSLTGNGALDIVAVAHSQVGYCASADEYGSHGEGEADPAYTFTEYGRWYGTLPYAGDWGTAFVLWCARQAGVGSDVIYGNAIPNPSKLLLDLVKTEDAAASGMPKIGDIAFFCWDFTDYTWDNCAVVKAADAESVTVIIGCIESGMVEEQTFSLSDSQLVGFASPAYGETAPNTVYFDANGGECDVESRYQYEGASYGALPEASRDGYVFAGWYNGGRVITEETEFEGGNITLTAKWELPKFTVTFDTLGKADAPASLKIEKGGTVGTIPVLTKAGYTFEGWFTSAEGGERFDVSAPINADVTLYARFKVLCGNVNGDGVVNMTDAVILIRYMAGWSGYAELVDLSATDLDGNGIPATMVDLTVLMRHLAGWNGYEKLPLEN